MIAKFRRILGTELGVAFLRTSFVRGIAAMGSLLLGVTLGRLYGAEGVGVFALAQSFLFGAGILTRFGMDNALMRYVGQDHRSPQALGYLVWAGKYALSVALGIALLIGLSRGLISRWFDMPELSRVLGYLAWAVPAFTLNYLLSGYMKGMHRPASACFLESGYISLIAALLLIAHAALGLTGEVGQSGAALALATWIVLLQGIVTLYRHQRARGEWRDQSARPADTRGFMISSRAFFVMSLAEFMQNVLAVVIAALLLDSHDLGLFKTAERSALLIGFILMIIAAIFPPRFSALYHQGEQKALVALARQSSLLGAVLCAPLLFVCLVVPELLLSLFGPDFTAAAPYLRILAIAQSINVSTAAVGFLLNMTGHEALMRNIALSSTGLGILAFVVSIPLLGAMGAALSLALVLVLQNVVALFFVRHRLGFWVYPAWHGR
jgi:O-antigen/teichoic acid export membrane protein